MRHKRDYRPQQLYAVTQRGNNGQWVYRDTQDFEKALELMLRYAPRHLVAIHGYCLMHNHGHWIFEAGTTKSISNLMRDMQARYSHYLNVKYKATPWLLLAPYYGPKDLDSFSPYLRQGPTNWTPRYHADFLDADGFQEFLRYLENNPVKAGLARRAVAWPWSSAHAHSKKGHSTGAQSNGKDPEQLLTFDRWLHLFGKPETMPEDWQAYLEEHANADLKNPARTRGTGSCWNRPQAWYQSAPPSS